MKIPSATVIVLLSLAGCATPGVQRPSSPDEVSIIRLIGSPREYRGKFVQVVGYLHLEFEGDALYIHKEDYERWEWKNGLWVSSSPEMYAKLHQLNDSYVLIEGVFDPENTGHLGGWSGSIRNISRAQPWPPVLVGLKIIEEGKPNQAAQSTTPAVTPPAGQEARQQ